MRKNRKNAGFTMVELITVVAILTILMGIAAVNIIKYQRDLKAKEADSAAKELFIAAQNHLTAADALGELESYKQAELESSPPDSFYAAVGTTSGKAGEYLITYPSGQDVALWEKMLPFGAIDETVRSGAAMSSITACKLPQCWMCSFQTGAIPASAWT